MTDPKSQLASYYAKKILRFLAQRKEKISPLLILTHDYPDPDALASAFALQHLAEKAYGIQSRIAYGGVIGRMENREMVNILKMPVHRLRPGDFRKFGNVALIDTQPDFENNPFPKQRRATIVIDQHPSLQKQAAELTVVDTECGATSVILAQALLLLKIEIPVRVATALAYGILSDTMNLFRVKRPDIVNVYMKLLPNCDMKTLARIQNPTRSRRFFTTLHQGIENAMTLRGLLISHLGTVESPDLVSQIADFLLTYKNVRWSFCTGRYKGKLHVSLRITSPTVVNAGDILRDIFECREEAGGHDVIGGGSFYIGLDKDKEKWQQAEQGLTERLVRRLRLPVKSEFHYPFREKEIRT